MKFSFCSAVIVSLCAVVGCVTPEDDGPQPTRVLMIGNSFSVSVMKYAPSIADSMAIDFDITSLYLGGCSLKRHMDNVKREWNEDHKPYSMTRNIRGRAEPEQKVNLPEVLKSDVRYDIVTIQQASHESWDLATYTPYGDDLIKLVREYQPQAKIYLQETWSYTPFDRRLEKWGFDQNEMYRRLHDAYARFAKRHGLEIIPMGTAIQRWRERLPVKYTDHSFGGDVVGGRHQKEEDQFKRTMDNTWMLNSDAFHLNDKGEYFQALVWIAKLLKEDVTYCEFVPENIDDREVRLMKEIANEFK